MIYGHHTRAVRRCWGVFHPEEEGTYENVHEHLDCIKIKLWLNSLSFVSADRRNLL